jgi:hypothetical protein
MITLAACSASGASTEWWSVLFPIATLAWFGAAAGLGVAFAERHDEVTGVRRDAERAETLLREGEHARATSLASRVLVTARSRVLRRDVWTTLAWGAIGKRDPLVAHAALSQPPANSFDVYLVAAYLSCSNRLDEAEQLLQEARALQQRERETTRLLIDVLVRKGQFENALRVFRADAALLSLEDWRAIEEAFPEARLA